MDGLKIIVYTFYIFIQLSKYYRYCLHHENSPLPKYMAKAYVSHHQFRADEEFWVLLCIVFFKFISFF